MDFSKSGVNVTSYDGHNINDGTNYIAVIPQGTPLLADTDPAYAERLDDYPVDTRTHYKERVLPLVVSTVAGTADTLKLWFGAGRREKKKLVLTDTNDNPDSTWYVYAKLKSFSKRRNSTRTYDIVLSIADPVWRENADTTESWTVTSSGQTENIAVRGTEFARPVISVIPRAANTSGYIYKRFVTIYNQTSRTFTNYPVNITGGNLDHAALVSGGKAQADGDDFRCFYDGEERDLWTGGGGFNSTTFRPWININLQPKIELTILGSIASSGAVATITVAGTSANLLALQKLRTVTNKVILIDSELFKFTNIVTASGGFQLTGCERALYGSSMAAHSAGATARWIEHVIWIYYGLSTATAPTAASAREPIISKASSTNTSWVYTDYFDPTYPGRPGTWSKNIVTTNNRSTQTPSQHYGANQATNTNFSAIASEMGISLKAWYWTVWRPEIGELEWRLYLPSGITNVTATGEKYRATASWPALVGLQASLNGIQWETIWNDATPASVTTWTALASHSAVSLGATYNTIRLVMSGTIAATASNLAHVEYDGITLALDSNTVPSVTLGAEQSQYWINVRIKNDTTTDYIDVKIPAAVDYEVTIDCENKTVTGQDGTNMRASLTYGPADVRQDWLTLDPTLNSGTNVISVTEDGVSDMDIEFVYAARSL